jgi:hypothetical protein
MADTLLGAVLLFLLHAAVEPAHLVLYQFGSLGPLALDPPNHVLVDSILICPAKHWLPPPRTEKEGMV